MTSNETTTTMSNLDLVKAFIKFPLDEEDKDHTWPGKLYKLRLASDPEPTDLGYMWDFVVDHLRGRDGWEIDDDEKLVKLLGEDVENRSGTVAKTTAALRTKFKVLEGWRDELYMVYGRNNAKLFRIERAASSLFGIVSYGTHLTVFQRKKDPQGVDQFVFCVGHRSENKQTYPDMLDNSVGGGIADKDTPISTLVRESYDEASLPKDFVMQNATAAKRLAYISISNSKTGGELNLLQPEVQYVYDLEVSADVVLKPRDGEVAKFSWMTTEEVQIAMKKGEFKHNCALIMLDFFRRHGILTEANESELLQIDKAVHREDLELPVHRWKQEEELPPNCKDPELLNIYRE